jgi:hypothetical protein
MPIREQVNTDTPQTLSGPKTLTSPVLNGAVCGGDPAVPLGVATKQFVESALSIQASGDNPVINGLMTVWQYGTTTINLTTTGLTAFPCDRWKWLASGTGVVQRVQDTNVPTVGLAGAVLPFSLGLTVTTADAAIAAGDFYAIAHRIEGYNWAPVAQQALTLSFLVKSPLTGIHCVALRNNAAATPDRCYVAEYNIAVANTWQKVVINVPASPSAGTWNYTDQVGIELAFVLACGATRQTTANAWNTGNFMATASQVNVMATAANQFNIVGVQIDKGTTTSPTLKVRPWQQDYDLSQFYFQKSFPYATTPAQNAGDPGSEEIASPIGTASVMSIVAAFPVKMRTQNLLTATYNPSAANAQARNTTDAVDDTGTGIAVTERSLIITMTGNATNTVGDIHRVHWTMQSEL